MYEYGKDKNANNSSGGSMTLGNTAASASYITTSSGPRVRKVTVTVYEYDKDGNITKETCTETEYTEGTWVNPAPYSPQPWQYPYVSYTFGTASGKLPDVDSSE
jgi:hypothetical protein